MLDLRLDVHRADPAVLTTFRILDAEPGRAWSVVGAERSTIERDGDALVVTTPLQSGGLRIEPLADLIGGWSQRELSALRCWMEAHGLTLEKRPEEVTKTFTMLMKLLEARGIDVSGGGALRRN
jgi:hypothetical protein